LKLYCNKKAHPAIEHIKNNPPQQPAGMDQGCGGYLFLQDELQVVYQFNRYRGIGIVSGSLTNDGTVSNK
jgi:hypothetical protein